MSGYFHELGGREYHDPEHGRDCTPRCAQEAVSSPLDRERPPQLPCPFCQAPAGVACRTLTGHPLTVFGRFHPSRLQGVAA